MAHFHGISHENFALKYFRGVLDVMRDVISYHTRWVLEYETTKVHRCSREGDAACKQPEPRNSRSRFPLNEEFDGTAKLHNGVKSRESGKTITKPKRKTVGTRGSEDALRRDKTGWKKIEAGIP